MANKDIVYYGIRHHGPGSCQRLLKALEERQPACVLIEGPTDCSEWIEALASSQMCPPVALLSYAADEPGAAVYYPFAEYSPEYQACLWALRNQVEVRFIDVPVNIQLAQQLNALQRVAEEESRAENEDSESDLDEQPELPSRDNATDLVLRHDPLALLAQVAGYEDAEAWWNDFIEQSSEDNEALFDSVATAMSALRDKAIEQQVMAERDDIREAYMRLEIAKHSKAIEGPVAVVCGAWHVPALKTRVTAKDDRALIKQLPTKLAKSKLKTTWIPWTSPRLASRSGYGAGVSAPMWYQHLWEQRDNSQALINWVAKVAEALRSYGHIVSTASVIEAVRLSQTLAAVRGRPAVGFEEVREAVVACLCFGESLLWQQLEDELLLGNQVGRIPDDAPLVPLLEDLQRQQKRYKLKPEALDKEISLDLRSDAGQGRSTLLHRLLALGVPWGRLSHSGNSRGTFRERWVLKWQPEFSIELVENLIYGSTIEQAANNKMIECFRKETQLGQLADAVQQCLHAQLHQAVQAGLDKIDIRAAHTSNARELLDSIAPLVDICRYGTARTLALSQVHSLLNRLAIQGALALPYACRNLNGDEAALLSESLGRCHRALLLAELEEGVMDEWWQALGNICSHLASDSSISGLCARLLYQSEHLSAEQLGLLLERMLSPALPVADAAGFFEGFFSGAAEHLIYDEVLRSAVENWLLSLDGEVFIECLPLFRRVFSGLDRMQSKRLLDAVLGRAEAAASYQFNQHTTVEWQQQLSRLGGLFKGEASWTQNR